MIPVSEFTFTFSRSSGAGGQNVNKVNSKVTMTWDMDASLSIREDVKERFKASYKSYIVSNLVVIHSQKHRSQKMNIDDCIEKLQTMIKSVMHPPKVRRKTRPTKSSVVKRLESKSKKSFLKKLRGEKF